MSLQETFEKQRNSLFSPIDHSRRTGIVFFLTSVFAHGLFFCSMVFFQDFKLHKPMPPVIQIDLVSFFPEPVIEEPAKSENSSQKEDVPAKKQTIKEKNRKISVIKPDISLKTKPKNLKDLMANQKKKKKKLKKKKEQIKQQINSKKELEKKNRDQDQDKIAQALSRLQKKVKEQDNTKKGEGKGKPEGYRKKGYKPIDLYNLVIGSTIEQNWVFNDVLAGMDQNLEVRILIKILKSGEIRDIIYETKSGNRYLDESAKKAIKKANPLPQLPAGLHSYDVGLMFTPKGLK